jgi:hypothetical protein
MPDHPLDIVEGRAVIRYKPCVIFNDNELPYVIWSEDAFTTMEFPRWCLIYISLSRTSI